MQLHAHDCILVAGGLNEYIWQAWATLEAKQNNVGQARKVCAYVMLMLFFALRVPCLVMTIQSAFSLVMATTCMQYCRDLHGLVDPGLALTYVLCCSCLMLPWLPTISMQPPGMDGVCSRSGKATSERLGTYG